MTCATQQCLRAYLPWICTSLALGYAAYIHYKLYKLRKNSQRLNKDKKLDQRNQVNIDEIDRNSPNKKVSYCRCYKSKKFPLCDGSHKTHNQENDDLVGPLNLVWVDDKPSPPPSTEPKVLDTSGSGGSNGSDQDKDMDIKSIDSESPKQSSNDADSNGEDDQIVKINNDNNNDEQLSSLEMIEDNFSMNDNNSADSSKHNKDESK